MSDKLVACFYSRLEPSQHGASLQASWCDALSVFAELGETVQLGSFGLNSPIKGLKEFQFHNFAKKVNAAAGELERGNLRHFSFCSVQPRANAAPAFDWDMIADCGWFSPMNLFVYQLGIDVGFAKTKSLDVRAWVRKIFENASRHMMPTYGHAFVMPSAFLPNGYSLGVMGGAPDFLLMDTNSWRQQCSQQVADMARNIHPYNYLNARHVDRLGKSGIELPSELHSRLYNGVCEWIVDERNADAWESLRWDNPQVVEMREKGERMRIFPWQSVFE
jgi:hypothetical protein